MECKYESELEQIRDAAFILYYSGCKWDVQTSTMGTVVLDNCALYMATDPFERSVITVLTLFTQQEFRVVTRKEDFLNMNQITIPQNWRDVLIRFPKLCSATYFIQKMSQTFSVDITHYVAQGYTTVTCIHETVERPYTYNITKAVLEGMVRPNVGVNYAMHVLVEMHKAFDVLIARAAQGIAPPTPTTPQEYG